MQVDRNTMILAMDAHAKTISILFTEWMFSNAARINANAYLLAGCGSDAVFTIEQLYDKFIEQLTKTT